MLHFYTSNRMEHLSVLLSDYLRQPTQMAPEMALDAALTPEWVVVQNAGMQHWLSMEVAKYQGIAMNLRYPFIGRVIWELVRRLIGDLPETSPYGRDILVWRLYELLPELVADDTYREISHYWWPANGKQDPLKRFQLARQLADLFEQYQLYRPDMFIEAWEADELPQEPSAHWQAKLWQRIRLDGQPPPHQWMQIALQTLQQEPHKVALLPQRMALFGINSMPPSWIQFLLVLSQYMPIHLFQLLPSDQYWLEGRSRKQDAQLHRQWLQQGGQEGGFMADEGHPLLGSLGRQGREFLSLIYEHGQFADELDLFVEPEAEHQLATLQRDLLLLEPDLDGGGRGVSGEGVENDGDGSIRLVSCHSPLREVQALHDWLLAGFDEDPSLTPRDVLVMCPEIEGYAPFIEAVFAKPWQPQERAQLPFSIADRSIADSHPLVQSFLSLLQLPDSRFCINEVMAHLRVPAVYLGLGLQREDLEQFEVWLADAAVHWGINAEHKQHLGLPSRSAFTWQEGLQRLLLGFAYGDQEGWYGDQVVLPWVEGADADKLGQLIHFLHTLQQQRQQLARQASAEQWQRRLQTLLESVYQAPGDDERYAYQLVQDALGQLQEGLQLADCQTPLPLVVVRDYLLGLFRQPQQGQHFMTGQVTFCSMLPMRSIPFRIIALLGLNDGDFPRQRQPQGFDLMVQLGRQMGDRSRRDDDRYLFLEALLSARDKLYLSYCGRSMKDNSERQPSLLVQELVDYLYPNADDGDAINSLCQQQPLQPFSAELFQSVGEQTPRSYDEGWLQLRQGRSEQSSDTLASQNTTADESDSNPWPETLSLDELVRFFTSPARHYAQKRLGLQLLDPQEPLADDEPFASSHLDRYQVQEALLQAQLQGEEMEPLLHWFQQRGQLPDTPLMGQELQKWCEEVEVFGERLQSAAGAIDWRAVNAPLALTDPVSNTLTLTAQLPSSERGGWCFYRLADCKGKDLLRAWLGHLVGQLAGDTGASTHSLHRNQGWQFQPVDDPQQHLQVWLAHWHAGQRQPLMIPADLSWDLLQAKTSHKRRQLWQDFWQGAEGPWGRIAPCPYHRWLWSSPPAFNDSVLEPIESLYGGLREHLQEWQGQ